MNHASPLWMLCSPAPCIPTSLSRFFVHTDSIILPYPPVLSLAHPLISFVGCHCLPSSFFFYRLIDKQTNQTWLQGQKNAKQEKRRKRKTTFFIYDKTINHYSNGRAEIHVWLFFLHCFPIFFF
jgi:hypothetical protein